MDSSRRLFPLSSCSIGVWTPVEGMRPFLLLCPDRKQFVVLLARENDSKARSSSGGSLSVNAVLAYARNYAALRLRHKNPFVDHLSQDAAAGVAAGGAPSSGSGSGSSGGTAHSAQQQQVLTFEVGFADVVGLDFRWPLTEEPRLVLEAACLCKRVFDSVDDVCAYYPPVRNRRLRALAAAAAGGSQPAEQHVLQSKQQQQQRQQQHGGGGGSEAATSTGMMSRVPSWASWASWTIGSTRTSVDITTAAAGVPVAATPAAAPTAAGAGLSSTQACCTIPPQQPQQQEASEEAGGQTALAGASDGADQQHQQQQQAQAAVSDPCTNSRPHSSSSCSGDGVDGSASSGGAPCCTLDSMISLNVGMAATAQQAAAAAAAAAAEAGADECSSCPPNSLVQPLPTPPAATAAAAPDGRSLHPIMLRSSGRRDGTPGVGSPALSSSSTPRGGAGRSDCSGVSEQHAEVLRGALKEASFGFWQQQHDGVLQDSSAQHNNRGQLHVRTQAAARRGAATAPCSMPTSPRQSSDLQHGNGPSPSAAAAVPAGDSPFESILNQRLRDHHHQQQEREGQDGLCQHRSRTATRGSSGSGSRRSSRSRLAGAAAAAAADGSVLSSSSCPLCHQALTQPHTLLQQRYHQQLEHRHVRLLAAAGHSSGGKAGRAGVVARSRSACSLQQLQQLQQQERAACGVGGDRLSGAIGGSGSMPGVQQQQQSSIGRQGGAAERSPLSPRAFAGMAAAAIGVLAARCKPGDGSDAGSMISGNSKHTPGGATEVGTPDAAGAAGAGAAGGQQPFSVNTPDTGGLSAVSSEQAAAAAVTPAGTHFSTATPTTGQSSAAVGLVSPPAAADASARVSVSDKAAAAVSPFESSSSADASSPPVVRQINEAGTADAAGADAAASAAGVHQAPAAADAPAGTSNSSGGTSNTSNSSGREALYSNRTVVLTFTDPTLPYQLSKLVKNPSNVHLLKLYESGLPAWAVVLPSYGLWYRPWLRRVTWLLFVLLSVVSMLMGFYDLWKNVPYFKQIVVGMFRPAAAVFEWLEGHTQIRLSILLTYMVSKSQLLVQVVKLLTDASLAPLLAPFAPLVTLASSIVQGISWLLQPFVAAAKLIFGPLGRLVWVILQVLWRLVSTLVWFGPLQLLQLLGSGFMEIGELLLMPFQALLPAGAGLRAGWAAAKATGQVARNAAPVVAEAARTGGASWWFWWWSPLEAFELMRVSTVRVVKALQAVLRFLVTLAATINKHRLSLLVQLRGKVWGGLQAAAGSRAGRVATVVAHKMGQGERLQRVQQQVARKLHGQDSIHSLNSMGSEMLGSLGPFSPAGGVDVYGFSGSRPYRRIYSMDGEGSDIVLETPEERGGSEEEEDGEVSSSSRFGGSTVGRTSTSSSSRAFITGSTLRQRAVTAAAAEAAAAMSAAGEATPTPTAAGTNAAFGQSQLLFSQHEQALYQAAPVAGSGLAATAAAGASSAHDPLRAAAAARAALSRSFHLPAGGLTSGGLTHTADLRALRQSYESSISSAVAASAAHALAPGGVAWERDMLQLQQQLLLGQTSPLGLLQQQQQPQQHEEAYSGVGAASVGVPAQALVSEAAGLLMMPQHRLRRQ